MKKIIIFSLITAFCSFASASITINFTFGPAYTAGGSSMVAAGTLGVLVADTGGGGLPSGNSLVGSSLTTGGLLGSSKILHVFQAKDITEAGSFGFDEVVNITDFSGMTLGTSSNTTGTDLGFYWFPGLTTIGDLISSGQSYGFFRSDIIDGGSGGDMSFNMPADGFTYTLAAYDDSLGGGYASSQFQANSTAGVAGIPEPSRMVLALVGFAGLMLRRRR